ncbi:MAG: hypothetical protein K2O42_07320 [Oscillospiraceae bacterium]|nr:hypothetical protein [Oscillospiraceae bacterium]
MRKKLLHCVALLLAISCFSEPVIGIAIEPKSKSAIEFSLSPEQRNSIEWLNHLAMISQEIDFSQNNRMYLEEVYNALMDNADPANLNERTEEQLLNLLDIIQKYRMNDIKREQLGILYERQKGRVLKDSIKDALNNKEVTADINLGGFIDFKTTISVIAFSPVDAYNSYSEKQSKLSDEYLMAGWELDSEEIEQVHENRKSMLSCERDLLSEYQLPSDLALSEETIQKFVEYKHITNVKRQIQFLESEIKTYKAFGSYWLLLSECYYKNQEYQKCLDAIEKYQDMEIRIFRKDYYLARALIMGIGAAAEILPEKDYIETAKRYLELIHNNTRMSDWETHYFCAQVYMDLYRCTKNKEHIKKAYQLLVNNINQLVDEQNQLNEVYLAEVEKIPMKSALTKEEKKQIRQHNKSLIEKRKTELPEIYEPLAVNCDLLFSLVNSMDLSDAEKKRVEDILYNNNPDGSSQDLFLTQQVRNWFSVHQDVEQKVSARFDGETLELPVSCLASGATITMIIQDGKNRTTYKDWKIKQVNRSSGNFNQFQAIYTSEEVKKQKQWKLGQTIQIQINNGDYANSKPVELKFKVSYYKEGKFILPDKYDFEQVT